METGAAVPILAEDRCSWAETIYLLQSPINARRLRDAVERDKAEQWHHSTASRSG